MTLLLVEYFCNGPLQYFSWTNVLFVSGIRSNIDIKHCVVSCSRGLVNKLVRLLNDGI